MGMIPKLTSLGTLGPVDYRSDKERIARYTKQTRNATRAQVAQNIRMLDLQREQLAQSHVHHVEAQAQAIAPVTPDALLAPPPAGPPAGWYPDPQGFSGGGTACAGPSTPADRGSGVSAVSAAPGTPQDTDQVVDPFSAEVEP